MNIKDFAEKCIQAEHQAFQRGDFSGLEALEAPDIIYHMGSKGSLVGHHAHKQDVLNWRKACPELKQDWKYLIGDGRVFALALKSTGRLIGEMPGYPLPAGKVYNGDYIFVFRVYTGRIAEVWANGSVLVSD
jgi:ketosteroid isomerase-like protein